MMTYEQVMSTLEIAGTAQNRKIYARHGAQNPMFGVSFAILRDLAKKNENDHDLALKLWKTKNYDARLLACQVADPARVNDALADKWVNEINNYVLSGEFSDLIDRSSLAQKKAEEWIKSPKEYVSRTGWLIIAYLVEHTSLPDSYFEAHIRTIEKSIHASPNRTRDAMNTALINIGLRPSLTEKSILAAERIGKVEVDHGETGCKTPDAEDYIRKTLDYRAKKKSKK